MQMHLSISISLYEYRNIEFILIDSIQSVKLKICHSVFFKYLFRIRRLILVRVTPAALTCRTVHRCYRDIAFGLVFTNTRLTAA